MQISEYMKYQEMSGTPGFRFIPSKLYTLNFDELT